MPHVAGDLEEERLLDDLLEDLLGEVELFDEAPVELAVFLLQGLDPLAQGLEVGVRGDALAADRDEGAGVVGLAEPAGAAPDDEDGDDEGRDDDPQGGLEGLDVLSHRF